MRYYKILLEENIVSVERLDRDDKSKGNLTKKEYESILDILQKCKEDQVVIEKDGEYIYSDKPKGGDDKDVLE